MAIMGTAKINCLRYPVHFYLLFFLYPFIEVLPGSADDSTSSSSNTATNASHHNSSRKSVGITVVLVFLGLLSVVGFSVFLFKLWQRKRRDEQQARLLKLFENDEDLEVELGIRD
ncbi:OLC1v1015925C1 [Oldenlandia corymbosa var. corymbosa]|uniref:OLC1v1015925C1 n=1 Tax=Oldenlandia corymbosa var. corymbosa TaxID=529605 RepID=A0AAV1E4L9_OLDCO|nr:OLC1v1015925C1 [Oldenlandia corymbosa var. corymbosa]